MLFAGLTVAIATLNGQTLFKKRHATAKPEWDYTTRSWQSQSGLPDQTVQAFTETKDGYLWVGTTSGLLRFDGMGYRLYNHVNTGALQEDDIFSLLEGHDGKLWIGTSGGGLLEEKNGEFRAFPVVRGQSSAYIRALAEDHSGRLWVGTDGGLFQVRNARLEQVAAGDGKAVPDAHAVVEDAAGRVWAGGSRLFVFDKSGTHEYALPGHDNRYQVKSLAATSDGVLWVGTVSGLYRLFPGSSRLEAVPGIFGLIRSLRVMPDGELWAGTIGSGIFVLRQGSLRRMLAPAPLVSNTVYSLYLDSAQNIWIGTLAGFMRMSHTPTHLLPLGRAAGADFGTVALDHDNSLWFASNELVHIVGERATTVHFPELGDVRVRNVLRARDGSLWVGTVGGGLYRFWNGRTEHFTSKDGLSSNFIQALLEGRDGSLWVGTNYGVSHLEHGRVTNLYSGNGLANNYIRALLEDREGTIWAGSERGLAMYRRGTWVTDALTTALASERIWALYQDEQGSVWIGTHGDGLIRVHDGKLERFTAENGLISGTIYSILGATRGRLWVSTPQGVMLLEKPWRNGLAENGAAALPLKRFDASGGLQAMQVLGGMQEAGAVAASGVAWFPTSHGLWKIDPDQELPESRLGLAIGEVSIDGQTVLARSAIQLAASSYRIEISFVPRLLSSQTGLLLRYRMEGLDRDWTYVGPQQRTVTYSNFPPGRFNFVVEAWQTDRPKHMVHTSLRIEKQRHFYQTFWFLLASLACLGGVLLLIYRLRLGQINARFRAVLAERTRLAREMHDTLIQGCIGVSSLLKAASSTEVGDEESRIHLIDFAAMQLHATVDEARHTVHNLRGEEKSGNDLPKALTSMAQRVAIEHEIRVPVAVHGTAFVLDPLWTHELLMVAREAVFNAILHGHAREVWLELAFSKEALTMTIHDNGTGFDASAALAAGHFGLRGMQERALSMGGTLTIESNSCAGTRIAVRIPRAAVDLDREGHSLSSARTEDGNPPEL